MKISPYPPLLSQVEAPQRSGFTLVELLTVVSIIAILALLALPNISALVSEKDLDRAINDISLTLTQARAYAVGHQTYVFVGLEETNASLSTTVTQQPGNGRVWMGVVATKDGTSDFSPYDPVWNYGTGGQLVLIQKPKFFNNIHLTANLPASTSANMNRPAATSLIGSSSSTPFTLPLGAAQQGGLTYFQQVIQFDPEGAASVAGTLTTWTEIGLEPTHGNALPSGNVVNIAAIQIEGTTGTVRVYRP